MPRQLVRRVLEHAQQREHVLDVRGLEVLEAAVFDVGDVATGQLELEVVGVVFDGNVESLPGDYIYLPEKNRSVTVDVRAILEALDVIYDASKAVARLGWQPRMHPLEGVKRHARALVA